MKVTVFWDVGPYVVDTVCLGTYCFLPDRTVSCYRTQ